MDLVLSCPIPHIPLLGMVLLRWSLVIIYRNFLRRMNTCMSLGKLMCQAASWRFLESESGVEVEGCPTAARGPEPWSLEGENVGIQVYTTEVPCGKNPLVSSSAGIRPL